MWPPPNVRLAILPFEGATNGEDMHAGVLQDISDRIRHMTSGRRSLVVISPSELADKQIQTPDQARDVLHATHVLQTKLKNEDGELVAHGEVIDLATKTSLREFTGRYSPDTVGTMPAAFAGSVSLALGLHGPATAETLSAAATPAYDKGLDQLRRDQASFDEAIVSLVKPPSLILVLHSRSLALSKPRS